MFIFYISVKQLSKASTYGQLYILDWSRGEEGGIKKRYERGLPSSGVDDTPCLIILWSSKDFTNIKS